MTERRAHSSYSTWLIFKFRAIEKILPNLKTKGKYGWVPAVALCFLVLLAALGIGVYLDGYVIHPPAQYTGVCPPPAQIKGGSCWLITVVAVTVSGTVTTATQSVPAGQVFFGNGTARR